MSEADPLDDRKRLTDIVEMTSICLLLAVIGSGGDLVGVSSGPFHITAFRHSIRRPPFWKKIFLLLLTPITVIPGIRAPSLPRSSLFVRSEFPF